jgi:hypothetical protein
MIRALSIMKIPTPSLRSIGFVTASIAAAVALAACATAIGDAGSGGATGTDGSGGSTGGIETGGTGAKAGSTSTGGSIGSGGNSATGAGGGTAAGRGGGSGTGGSSGGTGGSLSTGGSAGTGGSVATGGSGAAAGSGGGTGGTGGTGGRVGTGGSGGRVGTGGSGGLGTGGSAGSGMTGGTAGAPDACSSTVPTGGTQHPSNNASGTAAGLAWTIWSNGSGGSITTYSTPAFSAAWNNSGDFLARMGLQWNDTKTYDQYGTITAQFNSKKTGSGGGYSYIGIYGWSTSPCIEWYIVDDSYNKMPVNPGSTTNKGTAMIDGGAYTLYTRPTSGTGGSKCSGVSSWTQFYSVRQTSRTCGQISISDHFAAWAAAGMTLGKMDQAQILVEVGGGSGSIDFAMANITTTM